MRWSGIDASRYSGEVHRSIARLEEVIRAGFDSMDASEKSGKRHLRRAKPSSSLSRAERDMLEKGGLDLSPPTEGKDPIKATADLYRTHRSLYGLKEGMSWRLPAFQLGADLLRRPRRE